MIIGFMELSFIRRENLRAAGTPIMLIGLAGAA
jgi:hypothetical protein